MAMYCMRLANSQLLRICWSRPGSSVGCCTGAAIASERLRFRDPIAAGRPVKAGVLVGEVASRGRSGSQDVATVTQVRDRVRLILKSDGLGWMWRINGGVAFFSLSSCSRGEMISVNGASGRVDHVKVALGQFQKRRRKCQC